MTKPLSIELIIHGFRLCWEISVSKVRCLVGRVVARRSLVDLKLCIVIQ